MRQAYDYWQDQPGNCEGDIASAAGQGAHESRPIVSHSTIRFFDRRLGIGSIKAKPPQSHGQAFRDSSESISSREPPPHSLSLDDRILRQKAGHRSIKGKASGESHGQALPRFIHSSRTLHVPTRHVAPPRIVSTRPLIRPTLGGLLSSPSR